MRYKVQGFINGIFTIVDEGGTEIQPVDPHDYDQETEDMMAAARGPGGSSLRPDWQQEYEDYMDS